MDDRSLLSSVTRLSEILKYAMIASKHCYFFVLGSCLCRHDVMEWAPLHFLELIFVDSLKRLNEKSNKSQK